jgi:hypothetical protein
MRVRTLALVALVAVLATVGPAATPAPPETKSTAAKPVPPPQPPTVPERSESPDHAGITQRDGSELHGINEDITIPEGETHDGDVVCIRGHVTIGGHVNGDVTVVAGSLDIRGSVDGDVTAVVSRVDIDPKAAINGDLNNIGGSLRRNGAAVQGQVVNIPLGLSMPSWGHGWRSGWGDFAGFFFWWRLFAVFLFFVCALLLAALVPDRIRLISEEAPARLFTAFIFGLIGYVGFVFAQLFLTITIIGIPLVFLLYLVFVVLKWLAMCGIFHQIGHRMGRAMGRDMSLLGAILLGLLPFAVLRVIPVPCVGFLIWFIVEILAFGYLILTRVGTRGATPQISVRPPVVPPPSPPVTGVIVT